MTVLFSPAFNDAQLGTTGLPASGYQLFTYRAGTSTKEPVYTTELGNVAHSNPIILNSRGEPTSGPIWLTAGVAYDFVFTSPTDSDPPVAPIRTVEDVSGVNDPEEIADEWIASGLTPTYIGATQFSVPGDQTTLLNVGRRVKIVDAGGTKHGTIKASAYSSVTTVTLSGDALASPLTSLAYGILSATNTSAPLLADSFPLRSGSSDKTKLVALEVDGLTTDTTRTLTVQDASGTIALLGQALSNAPTRVNNLGATVTLSANALTFAIKDAAGNDPSATSPVDLYFQSSTLTTGTYSKVSITAATSITIPATATVGTTDAYASRIYFGILDNAGTPELCFWNPVETAASLSGNTSWRRVVSHLVVNPNDRFTTVANGTGADSAGVVYSTSSRSNVRVIPIACVRSTQTTAGTWAQAITALTLLGAGTAYGGQVVQVSEANTAGAVATGTTVVPLDDTLPEPGTDGDSYVNSGTFNLRENADILDVELVLNVANSAATDGMVGFLGSGNGATNAIAVNASNIVAAGDQVILTVKARIVIPGAAISISGFAGGSAAGTTTLNGRSSGRLYGGGMSSYLRITEVCA